MGWEAVVAEDQYHSADQFTCAEPPTADEWAWKLSGEQYDAKVQTVSWDFKLEEDLAGPLQAKEVSNNLVSPYLFLTYNSYTEAERI